MPLPSAVLGDYDKILKALINPVISRVSMKAGVSAIHQSKTKRALLDCWLPRDYPASRAGQKWPKTKPEFTKAQESETLQAHVCFQTWLLIACASHFSLWNLSFSCDTERESEPSWVNSRCQVLVGCNKSSQADMGGRRRENPGGNLWPNKKMGTFLLAAHKLRRRDLPH